MKIRLRGAAAALLASAALTAAVPSVALAASFPSCDLSFKVREIAGWDTNQVYNIIVWKESARGSSHFNAIALQGHVEDFQCKFGKAHYFWVAFRDGHFNLTGDGGYRNWAFHGRFTRNGNNVQFHAR